MKRILMIFLMGLFALMMAGCDADDFKTLGEAFTSMGELAEYFEETDKNQYEKNVTDVNTTDDIGGSNEMDV